MSHVIPRHVFQTLKSGRCNSNVFSAHQKLTEGNYVRLFGEERLPPAREIAAHPHGSPQMSHVIPRHVFQTLKLGRCNSNVFRAYRKLTKINYVRVFREERLPPADTGPARPRDRHTRTFGSEWSISKPGQALQAPRRPRHTTHIHYCLLTPACSLLPAPAHTHGSPHIRMVPHKCRT